MAFIEIEQDTNLLTGVYSEDAPGRIEITPEDQILIARSMHGHAQFMYIDGQLIESPDMVDLLTSSKYRNNASLTRMKFMLALDSTNLLTSAQAYVDDVTTPEEVKLMWAHATSFDRMHPALIEAMGALGITELQADALFGI